jgi:hypothetical protein
MPSSSSFSSFSRVGDSCPTRLDEVLIRFAANTMQSSYLCYRGSALFGLVIKLHSGLGDFAGGACKLAETG